MAKEAVLINTNTPRPPVSPVGLEYVAEALLRAGIPVRVIDLVFEADWRAAIERELKASEPLLVGVSLRNTDDCSFISGKSFLPWIREVVEEVKKHTAVPVFLGGVGFSILPETSVLFTGADGGINGDGEDTTVGLARALLSGESYDSLPNLVLRRDGSITVNRREEVDLAAMPVHTRQIFNNKLYEEQGAMVGVETKRGCRQSCVFCADPVAKGKRVRLRQPEHVSQEFGNLVAQGVTWFHMGDAEFNLPIKHAKAVCRALIDASLADKIHWYAYCAPAPFDRELASLVKRSGCAGINFGVDSLDDGQLDRLRKSYRAYDVQRLTDLLNRARINYIFDFLVGGPGETKETVATTIERIKQFKVKSAGIAVGLRVYPGTAFGRQVASGRVKKGLYPATGGDAETPLFYVSPALGKDPVGYVRRLVGDDLRFMLLAAPGEQGSYNYAGDDLLTRLIQEGARGAYWDILRKHPKSENQKWLNP